MNKKYIFIDIDGTLLSHLTGIPKSSLEAIDLARLKGHKVFINTGRVKSAVDDLLKFYPFDGFIYAAGGYVEVGGEVIYQNILDTKVIEYAVDKFQQHQIGYVIEGPDYSYYDQLALENFNKRLEEHKVLMEPQVMRHMVQENMVYPIKNYFENPQIINKLSVFADNLDEILVLEKDFDPNFEFINYEKSAEIISKGIDKSFGMQKVLKHYGASLEDAVSLGDSMNDYPMIRDAGIGIAMGNAHPNLKQVADYITFDVDDAGLYHALKKFEII